MVKKIFGILTADIKNIYRDKYLLYLILLPFIIGYGLRKLIPKLGNLLIKQDINIFDYYPLIGSYFIILMVPAVIGFISGFIWIDERDRKTLYVLKVMPFSFSYYFMYKIFMGMVLSCILVFVNVPFSNIVDIPIIHLFCLSILASFTAPMFAMILFIYSKNKVEAFAVAKYMYVLYLLPIIAYFVSSKFEILFWIIPTFWILKVFWIAVDDVSYFFLYYIAGFIYHILLLVIMFKFLKKKVYTMES